MEQEINLKNWYPEERGQKTFRNLMFWSWFLVLVVIASYIFDFHPITVKKLLIGGVVLIAIASYFTYMYNKIRGEVKKKEDKVFEKVEEI